MIKRRKSKGLTLMELMISMAIGLMLLAGALTMFVNNKRVYRQVNEIGRLQENARFALEMMSRDIRMAGFNGCHHSVTNVTNHIVGSTTAGSLYDHTLGIEGIEGAATDWSPSANTDAAAFHPSTIGLRFSDTTVPDAITVRYLSGESWDVRNDNDSAADPFDTDARDTKFMANAFDWVIVSTVDNEPVAGDRANDFEPGELLAVSDCASSDIFQLVDETCTSTSGPAACANPNGRIQRVDGVGTFPGAAGPGNVVAAPVNSFSRTYTEGTQVRRYIAVRYYIGNGSYGGPSLFRQYPVLDADNSTANDDYAVTITNQELIEGVENMQLMYGIDTDLDGVPENYFVADAASLDDATEWGNVVSVKISLLIRTVDTGFGSDTSTYPMLGQTVDPADIGVRRRVFTNTIQVRNRISR